MDTSSSPIQRQNFLSYHDLYFLKLTNQMSPQLIISILLVHLVFIGACIVRKYSHSPSRRFSAHEVKHTPIFNRLILLYAIIRSFTMVIPLTLYSDYRIDWLQFAFHQTAECVFFSISTFQVLFWIDIVNSKVSLRSRLIWRLYLIVNGIVYTLFVGNASLELLDLLLDTHTRWKLWLQRTSIFMMTTSSMFTSAGLLYSMVKLHKRVRRVMKQQHKAVVDRFSEIQIWNGSREEAQKRFHGRVQKKLFIALIVVEIVLGIVAITFLLRTFVYGTCMMRTYTVVSKSLETFMFVALVLCEALPVGLFFMLMWKVEPSSMLPSVAQRRPSRRMSRVTRLPAMLGNELYSTWGNHRLDEETPLLLKAFDGYSSSVRCNLDRKNVFPAPRTYHVDSQVLHPTLGMNLEALQALTSQEYAESTSTEINSPTSAPCKSTLNANFIDEEAMMILNQKSIRSSSLSLKLGDRVLEKTRVNLFTLVEHMKGTTALTPTTSNPDENQTRSTSESGNNLRHPYYAAQSYSMDDIGKSNHAWLSFQCFNLKLPFKTPASSTFLVLHAVNANENQQVLEIGRTEISKIKVGNNEVASIFYHLMIAVNIEEVEILRASVYDVRNMRNSNDLESQWLIGQTVIPAVSYRGLDRANRNWGHATMHKLYNSFPQVGHVGDLIVRYEADVQCASTKHIENTKLPQRITRAFVYRQLDLHQTFDSQTNMLSVDGSGSCRSGRFELPNRSETSKILIEEELVESVYTWEIPYQLLQLVLSDLLYKVKVHEQEILSAEYKDKSDETLLSAQTHPHEHSADHASQNQNTTLQNADPSIISKGNDEISMLSEMIYHIQDDAMERKERKWRFELLEMMKAHITMVEKAILLYSTTEYNGLTFKPSTKKADPCLSFLALNLHQQLLTIGSAVPTSKNDVGASGAISPSSGLQYSQLVDSFDSEAIVSPASANVAKRDTRRRLCDYFAGDDSWKDGEEEDDDFDDEVDGLVEVSDEEAAENSDDYMKAKAAESSDDYMNAKPAMISAPTLLACSQNSLKAIPLTASSVTQMDITPDISKTKNNSNESVLSMDKPERSRSRHESIQAMEAFEEIVSDILRNDHDLGARFDTISDGSCETERGSSFNHVDRDDLTRHTFVGSKHSESFRFSNLHGTTTVGAFAAHVYGFKKGGIRQMQEEVYKIQSKLEKEIAKTDKSEFSIEVLTRQHHELSWHIDRRLEVAFCQSLSALVTCFQQTLFGIIHSERTPFHPSKIDTFGDFRSGRPSTSAAERGIRYLEMLLEIGFLFSVESLLSTYSKEAGMLGDMDAAIRELQRCRICLRRVNSPKDAEFRVALSTVPGGILIELPLIMCDPHLHPERSMHRIPGQDRKSGAIFLDPSLIKVSSERQSHKNSTDERLNRLFTSTISVAPILFSQGVNEMQTVANTVGKASLQREINIASFSLLEKYFQDYCKFNRLTSPLTCTKGSSDGPTDHKEDGYYNFADQKAILEELRRNVHRAGREKKCMEILTLSSFLARSLGGGRVTCCKSAKDRTAMSVTLEQANLLVHCHRLRPDLRDSITSLLRTHGVRRENARKNIGQAKYCFSALQNYMLPTAYKCPPGTGGGSKS
uniref:Type I inositol3 putative n=1 Tax=Albugo laibachii Nc14 TaxID=890382 RepID=F0WC43_9STRA|nr:type I inositol3 putative [Albugo laibachii Nc14]CCA25208.1 type I inositol3 putative [Albugo laibachii Nc14]|eukprot:CCA25208.1 type I inositol3 putative [Albugo laibachii Nc14]